MNLLPTLVAFRHPRPYFFEGGSGSFPLSLQKVFRFDKAKVGVGGIDFQGHFYTFWTGEI